MMGAANLQTIAIIDDDQAVSAALERLLWSMGFGVTTFDSAEDFLLTADPGDYDCLLLDVQLSGISGLDLAERLASSRVDVRIILLTAAAETVARNARVTQLASAVLMKPVDASVLAAAVENAVGAVALT
jgi:two-component system, LuxR family, response regulator DctR